MQDILERDLTRDEQLKLRNNRTGLALLQLSWIMVFVCLSVVNIQLRWSQPSWPPPGVAKLSVFLPAIATALLIVSSYFARRGGKRLSGGDLNRFQTDWRVTLLLGLIFVALMGVEWMKVPDSGQYSDVFRVLSGFHVVHALAIGLYLWRVTRHAATVGYTPQNFFAVEAGVKLWYFVVIAWLLFFAVLYVF
jgi:heme/copper-type cytochrome/quinol oxidase subunit 3